MIVVAVVVLFGVLAYVGSKRSSPSRPHAAASTTHTSHPASATTGGRPARLRLGRPPTDHGHHRAGDDRTKAKAKAKADRPTPTTRRQVVALTSTSTSATYPVANSNYR